MNKLFIIAVMAISLMAMPVAAQQTTMTKAEIKAAMKAEKAQRKKREKETSASSTPVVVAPTPAPAPVVTPAPVVVPTPNNHCSLLEFVTSLNPLLYTISTLFILHLLSL